MHSLRSKLLLSFAILVLGIGMVAGWSVYNFTLLGRAVARIMANNYRSVLDAQVMKEALERQDSALLFHAAGHPERALHQFRANRQRFETHRADAAANLTEAGESEVIQEITAQFQQYSRRADRFLSQPATPEARRSYFTGLEPRFSRLKERCDALLRVNQDAMLRAQRQADAQAAEATRASIGLALMTLALGAWYAVSLSRRLVAPLIGLTEAARHVGQGDLNFRFTIRTADEVEALADEFTRMTANLREYRSRDAARLQVAEQQAEAAINSLYEPVVVTGSTGEILRINRAGESLFGGEGRWRGLAVERLSVTPLGEAVRQSLAQGLPVAPEGDRGLSEIRNGIGVRCYRVRTAPILQSDEQPGGETHVVAGTVTVLEDVTRIREVDRLKDEFISVASHELRTPLTSMQLSIRLLQEGSAGTLSAAQQDLLSIAITDAERLEKLTRDLLDLTRLEAGTAPPALQPLEPEELLRAGAEPLRAIASSKGVTLQLDAPADLPPVQGDPLQLTRVVTNLVGNAVRHTPSGGQVTLTAAAEDGELRFSVRDTGPGIPADYLPRIFDRFVQVPGSTTGGAGLGLPIARKIIETHGGRIWAESAPGIGATFTFTLPLEPRGSNTSTAKQAVGKSQEETK